MPGDTLYDADNTGYMVLAVSCEIAKDEVDVRLAGVGSRKYRLGDRVAWLPRDL
jgi:hypothetical protein